MPTLCLYNIQSDLQTSSLQIGSVQIANSFASVVDSDVENGVLRIGRLDEVNKLDSWSATRNGCFSVGVTCKTRRSAVYLVSLTFV
jgi:hypothetical protein